MARVGHRTLDMLDNPQYCYGALNERNSFRGLGHSDFRDRPVIKLTCLGLHQLLVPGRAESGSPPAIERILSLAMPAGWKRTAPKSHGLDNPRRSTGSRRRVCIPVFGRPASPNSSRTGLVCRKAPLATRCIGD